MQDAGNVVHGVDGRVQADEGIAAAERKAPIDEKGDAAQIVGRMIGLQARGERARQTQERAGSAGPEIFRAMQINSCTSHNFAGAAAITPVNPGPMRRISPLVGPQQVILQFAQRPAGNVSKTARSMW